MSKQYIVPLAVATTLLSPVVLAEQQPKLVLQITIDALRGDLLDRFRANMGEGGFQYLLDEGVHYTNAHYQHANTETIVGHASLATGAPPSAHGMIGNVWYDRAEERIVYNVEDSHYSLLTENADIDHETEIDDTKLLAQSDGRSPLNIHTSTFSDELIKAYNGHSRAYSVSFKDRSAVAMAGELGKAFWFSSASGTFVTTDYYYDDYPVWVNEWNAKDYTQRYHNQRWELLLDRDQYLFAKEGNVDFKTEIGSFKRSFPYPYGPSDYPYFNTMLSLGPASDEITVDFAMDIITKEELGTKRYPDYLSLSLSATDYVIHTRGPSSLEAEDNLLHLDRTLARLFSHVDKEVGLENTLIVLSADHGAPDAPEFINNLNGDKADYFGVNTLEESDIFERTKEKFGLGKELLLSNYHPYLYLNQELIAEHKLDLAEVQKFIAELVVQIPGVDQAFTSSDIENGTLVDTRVAQVVKNNHFTGRSGDIFLVYDPNVYINDFDGLIVPSVHGSPWRYDSFVPVIFAGFNLEGKRVGHEVTPYDISPTMSNILGITPPSGSTGNVLTEVLVK